jgi:Ca-activated chloride channel family protein
MSVRVRRLILPTLAALAPSMPAQHHPHWVVPPRAVLAPAGTSPVHLVRAEAKVDILDRAASTTIEVELHNPSGTQQEAVLLLPVPDDAAVSNFAFEGQAAEPTAQVLPREEARRLYAEITAKLRDPALLEFAGFCCLRTSVFPVPALGRQRVRLIYDHVLEADAGRVDYVLPRSESLAAEVPWTIEVRLRTKSPLGLVYSPSHELVKEKKGTRAVTLRLAEASRREPGSFRLCFSTRSDAARPTATLFAYPDPSVGGGYFLLLAEAPPKGDAPPIRREVTLVLDRSGSMAGKKLQQAKAAALQVLEGLADGEGIQLIDFGNTVGSAFARPVVKDAATMAAARRWIADLRPHGGTNIYDALQEALRAPVLEGSLPLVLFLTDGLPTVGPTRESDLHELIAQGNPHQRRVFCFGVGHDVNAPLLDHLAEATRAVTTYVGPEDDVERRVARVFSKLDRPVLAEPALRTVDEGGAASRRTSEVLPAALPDLFAGDQLVVLGRYHGDQDLRFELAGRGPAGPSRHAFALPVRTASVRHAFVPRLWASRQIAFLVDALRQQGGQAGTGGHDPFANPRARELRDEILRLSTRFGVLGEYTAFLAREGSDLGNWQALAQSCQAELQGRAVVTRSGAAAVNQGYNLWAQKGQERANYRNVYVDQNLQVVETATVQQVCDRGFWKRGERWVDGQSVLNRRLEPDERVEYGSPRFVELQQRLEAEGRGAVLSLRGEVLLELAGKNVLVTWPAGDPK